MWDGAYLGAREVGAILARCNGTVRSLARNSLFLLAAWVGCSGDITTPGGAGHPDASTGGKTDGGTGMMIDAGTVDAGPFLCRNKITTGLDTGHHNVGQDCQQSCHNHGFVLSGTLYNSAAGGTGVAGASITFVDAAGYTGDMHTNQNGNFWWSLPVTFPVKIGRAHV